jgi:uncharacterized protein (TIGR00369 family)
MSLLRQIGSDLPGVEQLRRMAGEDRQPGMAVTLGMRIAEIGEGRVTLTATPGPHVENTNAVAQGGFAAALLDMACGYAVITRLAAGRTCSTIELKVAYHRPVRLDAGVMRAEGVVVHMGSRIAYSEARLLDEAGKLYASASSTLMLGDI